MTVKAKFPIECIENIFNHLSGDDLLKCTVVCPAWNVFIGSTRSCMKRIEVMWCWTYDAIWMNSNRKYENVQLRGNCYEEMQKFLSSQGRRWTSVSAYSVHFLTSGQFVDFMQIFQSSVQKLSLFSPSVGKEHQNHYNSTNLQFP